MKSLLFLSICLFLVAPTRKVPVSADGDSQIAVLGFKFYKSRQTVAPQDAGNTAPASAMIPANKNFERNRRINDPAGMCDPNADTIDGRSAAMEKKRAGRTRAKI